MDSLNLVLFACISKINSSFDKIHLLIELKYDSITLLISIDTLFDLIFLYLSLISSSFHSSITHKIYHIQFLWYYYYH